MTDVRGLSRGWVGRSPTRVEDRSLLLGQTRFVDDLPDSGALHAAFVRSPLAAAGVLSISTAAALRVPGVTAVITAADLADLRGLRAVLRRPGFVETEMPLLAADSVRHVGEPVAIVLADSPYTAEDGAELVSVDYQATRAVASIEAALADDAPSVHNEAPGNVLITSVLLDDPELDDLLSAAPVVIEALFSSARVTALPMETKACLAEWSERDQRLTLSTSTQLPHMVRTVVADLLGLPEQRVRVIAPDVGGGFGQKCVVAREEVLVAALAHRLRRSVKWVEDRQENLTASASGHEQRYAIRAGFDSQGRMVALDADIACDVGAYSCFPMSCAVEPLMAAGEMSGPYRLPRYRVRTRGVATNKPLMAPYRGVSRPQITLVMERLMDKAARRLGLSPVEIRHRNLIRDQDFPYRGLTGIVYDRGSYAESLDRCADLLKFDDWAARQAAARAEGRLLGLGFSCFSERTGYGTGVFAARGMDISPGFDAAEIAMDPSGGVTVAVGTSGHGQGHQTTLAQIVADELGVELDQVRVVEGDTDATPYGWGTFASRSAVIGGGACKRAATGLGKKIARIAAHELEAAPGDIELVGGTARVRGSPDAAVAIADIARIAYHAAQRLPEGEDAGLQFRAGFDPPGTFSNATHGCVVEVSPETGDVAIRRYVVVEDCGVIINPQIVDGQVRGGVAQGIAAALYERLMYDAQGQCQTGSLIDYLVPTASEIPPIEIDHLETPSEHSETGAKGMGEGGTIGAPACVANAVADALGHLGIEVDDIPILPERLLSGLRQAREVSR